MSLPIGNKTKNNNNQKGGKKVSASNLKDQSNINNNQKEEKEKENNTDNDVLEKKSHYQLPILKAKRSNACFFCLKADRQLFVPACSGWLTHAQPSGDDNNTGKVAEWFLCWYQISVFALMHEYSRS